MPVKCATIIEAMEKFSPDYLAEAWDNVGLLVGNPDQEVSNILVALDVTEKTVEYAISEGCEMIIAHHPLIFKSLSNVCTVTSQGRIITELIKNNIAVYSAHTNLDVCSLGVNDALAEKIGLLNTTPLVPTPAEKLYKLVVFVPETHAEVVRSAISEAGAGHIGNYSHCTFQTNGIGRFMPLAGTNPHIGKENCLEAVAEIRLETILRDNILEQVLQAILEAHPYEEVSYDIFELVNKGNSITGLGRIGFLPKPLTLRELSENIKRSLNLQFLKIAGELNAKVCKIAVCGGSGGDLVQKALEQGSEVLVTGDVKYHEAQAAVAAGISIIDAGHFATEIIVLNNLQKYLNDCALSEQWKVIVFKNLAEVDIFMLI